MKYCTRCGRPMGDGDRYCSHCGCPGSAENRHPARIHSARREPAGLLCCELAYTGTLFWLPLLVFPGSKEARYHANQGLWLLILSVAGCTGIRLLGFIDNLLAGTLVGTVFHGVYALAFMIFLAGMFFLLWNALTSALKIHRGNRPRPILFFARAAIIR